MEIRSILPLAIILFASAAQAQPNNLLRNGDFETGDLKNWFNGAGTSLVPGHASQFAANINQPGAEQQGPGQIALIPAGTSAVEVSYWVKAENLVLGKSQWNTARVSWAPQDSQGTQIGPWNGLDAPGGTYDWRQLKEQVPVPAGTAKMVLFVSIEKTAHGSASFDDVSIALVKDNQVVANESRTDTTGWYPLSTTPADYSKKPATDLSFLLDAPAGKYGYLGVKDGHFAFSNGKRIRFWGVNIGGQELFNSTKEKTVRTLDRLAQSGCNMVRLHQLDAAYREVHLFGSGSRPPSTRQLSPARLDQVDFVIAEAAKRGIYVYLDLLTGRVFGGEDLVPDADKLGVHANIVSNFDPRIIELQKEFASQLLTHKNSYNGLRYVDDPAIALSEINNESSLFDKNGWKNVPPSYRSSFTRLFAAWCAKGKVSVPQGDIEAWFKARDPIWGKFLLTQQNAYFADMRAFLKGLGVKYPLAGSNWQSWEGDLISNADQDFIDRHTYWDHPSGGWGVSDTFKNQPEVKLPGDWQSPGSIARNRIEGKPFLIGEWNNCRMNEYLTEGPLLMTATAAFQDWDGLLHFSYGGDGWNPQMKGIWNVGEQPQNWAPRLACALIFQRGDLAPATTSYTAKLGDPKNLTGFIEDHFPPGLAYLTKISGSLIAPVTPVPPMPAEKDTYLNPKGMSWTGPSGIFTVNTPQTQAALGFISGQTIKLDDLQITPKTPFCQIIVSSLDGQPIAKSKRMLLTTTARAENTNTIYNAARTSLKSEGTAPILLEPVVADLKFSGPPVTVTPLDHNGYRTPQRIPASADNIITVGTQPAFWYEITRG